MSASVSIGMSQRDITPPARMTLLGQFHTRISESVESPLTANVFAAEAGGEQIILCSCDLGLLNAEFCDRVRTRIRGRSPDIDVAKIVFCATHTHTGPGFLKMENSLHVAAGYLPEGVRFVDDEKIPADVWREDRCGEYLADRLCEAVCDAWERRGPALFSPAFGRAVLGHCRRVVYDDGSAKMYGSVDAASFRELEGGNDSGVELLYVFDQDRRPRGALVNVACPSQCVESQRYVSSDFWGKARDRIKSKLGDGFVVVGLCGAAGDQSPRDLIRRSTPARARRTDPNTYGLEGAEELGKRLADLVLEKLPPASETTSAEAVVRCRPLSIDFPLRRVTPSEYEAAKRSLEEYVAKCGKTVLGNRDMAALHVFGGTMERHELQEKTDFWKSRILVARFGDVAIASNPFELFLDYGNQIRARSPAPQTLLIQLADDDGLYLPTAKAEKGGHYSAYVSSGRTGHEGGELLVRTTLETLRELWS